MRKPINPCQRHSAQLVTSRVGLALYTCPTQWWVLIFSVGSNQTTGEKATARGRHSYGTQTGRKEGKEKVHWQNVKCQAANVSKWQVKQRTGNQPKPVTCRHVIYVQEQRAASSKQQAASTRHQQMPPGTLRGAETFEMATIITSTFSPSDKHKNTNEQLLLDTHHISKVNLLLVSNLFKNYIKHRNIFPLASR